MPACGYVEYSVALTCPLCDYILDSNRHTKVIVGGLYLSLRDFKFKKQYSSWPLRARRGQKMNVFVGTVARELVTIEGGWSFVLGPGERMTQHEHWDHAFSKIRLFLGTAEIDEDCVVVHGTAVSIRAAAAVSDD